MILIPLDRPIDWRNPPVITLLLVLVNIACLFIWQHNDEELEVRAEQYYLQESGLYPMEMTAYYRYRHPGNDNLKPPPEFFRVEKNYRDMQRDGKFNKLLLSDQVITPSHSEYAQWKPRRNHYNALLDEIVSYRFALNPSNPNAISLFTNIFLHADFDHLLGNMVILMMMGYVVEIILGHGVYLISYLFAGLLGDGLYILVSHDVNAVGLGASGAVFGVAGMYLVLFGMRKIRFFFFFIYFNYFKAPALIMLIPLIGWQLYMHFFLSTHINVMAHLGGLAGGAMAAFVAKIFLSKQSRSYLDANIKNEQYQQAFTTGQQQLAAMNMKAARQTFEKLLQDYPNDIAVKLQLFNILKFTPDSPDFHRLALQLIAMPGGDRATVKIVHDIFTEYTSKAKPRTQLTPDILITLVLRFAANDYLSDAEKIMTYLMHAKRDLARNAEGLSTLSKYYNGKDKKKSDHFRALLLQTYPESTQAQHLMRSTS